MTQYLTLSRAARLVGTKRGSLQKKIRNGELIAFEGMLDIKELQRVYPNVELEDSTMLEKVDRYIENALAKRLRKDAVLPDAETLMERIGIMSQELAAAQAEVSRYAGLMNELKPRVASLSGDYKEDTFEAINHFKAWFLHALEGEELEPLPDSLLAREAFLRVMAAHVRVMPSGQEFFSEGSTDVLDAGLRGGVSLPYGCTDGSCGRCRVKLVSGGINRIKDDAQPLSDSDISNGYFLACNHTAVTDIVIDVDVAGSSNDVEVQQLSLQVQQVERIDNTIVVQCRYQDQQRLQFLSGQFARLQFADGSSSEAAIASCPCDDSALQFHLSDQSNAGFWQFAANELQAGQSVMVKAPYGDFMLDAESSRPLIFIAVENGFAAIKSLIEHAMAINSADEIRLYWLFSADKPYLNNLCRSWADALDEFHYMPLKVATDIELEQSLENRLIPDCQDIGSHDIYICAPDDSCLSISSLLERKAAVLDKRIRLEPIRAN
ncbi:MAG: 2Fe-2S iron-sulfur cluster-binding protein [Gammaproteobacteria bacterium]